MRLSIVLSKMRIKGIVYWLIFCYGASTPHKTVYASYLNCFQGLDDDLKVPDLALSLSFFFLG